MNKGRDMATTSKTSSSVQIAPEVANSAATSAAAPLEPVHDVVHQIHLVREALQSEKRRVGFFFGAGCPLGIYNEQGLESLNYIPAVAGLTANVGTALNGLGGDESDFKTCWTTLTTHCTGGVTSVPNVEHILTQLRTICALKGTQTIGGMTSERLRKLDAKICELIAATVGKTLPAHITAYHRFAAWIGHIERDVPVEVFTPNYDLLLEEAFEQYKVAFFDGFVGAREPFFDIAAMEQDALPPRWTRLWKLHGSINWIKRTDESVFRCHHAATNDQQLLIYPSHLKYDQSRRMPYLAMIDRLRAFFRDTNPVLVICGYSFADEHLNEVLLNGLRGNRSAHCFALMHPSLDKCGLAAAHAAQNHNLTVLAWDGAVIRTRKGGFKSVDRTSVVIGCGYDVPKPENGSPGETLAVAQCRLGDFHHFAMFLETQFGVKVNDHQNTEAR